MLLPQLHSRSSVQFSYQVATVGYRISNQLADGSILLGEATRPAKRCWDLMYRGLTAEELSVLNQFCNDVGAGGDGFVMLDPSQNLLSSSEDLTHSVWLIDPMVSVVAAGSGAPQTHIVTNSGNSEQGVSQDLDITGVGRMCASCIVRSDVAALGRLILNDGTVTHATSIECQANWQHVYLSADVNAPAAPLSVSVAVEPGSAIEVKEVQLEYQPFPSQYKPTAGKGGVFRDAYVLASSFQVSQHGPDWFDCSFRIVA